ncbi:MAG: response regulator transcription factor [Eubacterium sp.]|jgi:DNA-binding response OmpR family regulator|nr:response regulator transcription factor [Eubacterium sp.]
MIEILVAEDDEIIQNLIKINLEKAGYLVSVADDGVQAAKLMDEKQFDLCLFDIMLPKIDGYELLDYAKTMEYPVIFITAMGTTNDKVKGLRSGADDYITKPFEIVEMLARVENVLRRYKKTKDIIIEDDVTINLSSMQVTKGNDCIDLTLKEFQLLVLLLNNKNVALYREVIYENVWESDYMGNSRTVDLHIQRLRRKLKWEEKIESVYKVGYRLKG